MPGVSKSPQDPPAADGGGLSPSSALVLAAWFGLVVGYLDLGMIFVKRDLFHASHYYEQGRHFRWVVPVANVMVLMLPGVLVAVVCRLRRGWISARNAAWLLGTLALWGPLLRAPIHGVAAFLLAAGIARVISRGPARDSRGTRWLLRSSLAALLVPAAAMAVVSPAREHARETRSLARLPPASRGAKNVLLLVMDTVRAENLGLYGYGRGTTPHLSRWAKRGVKFDWALAPAPWTFPSHCSFLTGQWPSTLNAHWQPTLDAPYPTLAEFLAARGYVTGGFAANTRWCTYESRLDRGFVHYEDYPLGLWGILTSTPTGRWLLRRISWADPYYAEKWIGFQSRDARDINRAFLDWLSRERQRGRPFFAFLNYMDAHEPFVPPADTPGLGRRPRTSREYRLLLDYWDRNKLELPARDVELARDAYDTCIAALDRQIGALLDELDRAGTLRDTLVIVTSDHGEEFGEHGVFNHGFSVYAQAVHVPLLVIDGSVPAGRTISEPVSLRDLPATIVALLGLGGTPRFPGRVLSECWESQSGAESTSAVAPRSEVYIPQVVGPERGRGPVQRDFTLALMDRNLHYLVDVRGVEALYNLAADVAELRNLKDHARHAPDVQRFRDSLLRILPDAEVPNGFARDCQDRLRARLLAISPGKTP
jgi:arylsulfatase A-like enzyme